MKKIEAVVRPEVVGKVRDALVAAGVGGITFTQAQGLGSQRGFTEFYRGTEVLVQTQPKVRICLVVENGEVEELCALICEHARSGASGKPGDGKIFISPVESVIRIRTGERDSAALASSPIEKDV